MGHRKFDWKFFKQNTLFSPLLKTFSWTEEEAICKSNGFTSSCYYPSTDIYDSFIEFLKDKKGREIFLKKLTFHNSFPHKVVFWLGSLANGYEIEDYVNIEDTPVEIEYIAI